MDSKSAEWPNFCDRLRAARASTTSSKSGAQHSVHNIVLKAARLAKIKLQTLAGRTHGQNQRSPLQKTFALPGALVGLARIFKQTRSSSLTGSLCSQSSSQFHLPDAAVQKDLWNWLAVSPSENIPAMLSALSAMATTAPFDRTRN